MNEWIPYIASRVFQHRNRESFLGSFTKVTFNAKNVFWTLNKNTRKGLFHYHTPYPQLFYIFIYQKTTV